MFSTALIVVSAVLMVARGACASTSNVIDLSVVESAPPPPHDLDITIDHPLSSYNIAYNSSWVITNFYGTALRLGCISPSFSPWRSRL